MGYGSIAMIYSYVLVFDFLRCLGHCNFEIIPHQLFLAFPFMKYLIYTPTYHSLHHTEMGTNYCLFMPLFDVIGNTLNPKSWEMHTKASIQSAAVILNQVTKHDVNEVFLTGATSKLGRAIALYLCTKQVRVLMLTSSTERFQKILKEAPSEDQKYLVHVTKYQAAKHCKTWIVGKWITPREQKFAPVGAHFHQFVVPPVLPYRSDCTYGDLAAMRLPPHVKGLGSCEYTMERGVVHACHAGGVVHSLEGWTHHEVGAIDVQRIDLVWEAALKHGLMPVSSFKKTD
ncbi:hypothetical protein H5410_059138 [Solanum commersonii]|uniref:Very-long-chain aldehyde decarbonylase CER1-like C-terminal domain-containing protein n=1 Tax=Solanum commersonii TaxID=4109 RepID=A0A9J5W227_SOLCO|nr:hypothetical protein H5410_059138 [Solanum commersonii]